MNFSLKDKCVVAVYQESDQWAVAVIANRKQDGSRTITPFIFCGEHSDLFATCPALTLWAATGLVVRYRTRELNAKQRKALINNAVIELIEAVAQRADILEVYDSAGRRWRPAGKSTKLGILARLAHLQHARQLANFALNDEPAYRWLVKNSAGAWGAHRAVQYLALKYRLTTPTHEEWALAEEKAFLKRWGNKGGL